jgi:hypothetical protein
MRAKRRPARELRATIDQLPLETRRAMLEGVKYGRILVGAYVNRSGELAFCPMFAAYRRGDSRRAVWGMAISATPSWDCHAHMRARPGVEKRFAKAWDLYARGRTGRGPRRAASGELCALKAMLEASIDRTCGGPAELSRALAEQAAGEAKSALERRPQRASSGRGEVPELEIAGGSWLRLCRTYDEYEAALREIGELDGEPARRTELSARR